MDLTVTLLKAVVIIAGLAFLAKGLASPSIKNKPWFAFRAIGLTILFVILITAVEFAIGTY